MLSSFVIVCRPLPFRRNTFSNNLATVFLEFPVPVIQRTDLTGLEPSRYAVEVESVIADSPGYCAFLTRGRGLVGLTFDTKVHNVVSANGTVINDDIPSPESNGTPLLDFEPLLSVTITAFGFGYSLGGAGIWHINIHGVCLFGVCLRED